MGTGFAIELMKFIYLGCLVGVIVGCFANECERMACIRYGNSYGLHSSACGDPVVNPVLRTERMFQGSPSPIYCPARVYDAKTIYCLRNSHLEVFYDGGCSKFVDNAVFCTQDCRVVRGMVKMKRGGFEGKSTFLIVWVWIGRMMVSELWSLGRINRLLSTLLQDDGQLLIVKWSDSVDDTALFDYTEAYNRIVKQAEIKCGWSTLVLLDPPLYCPSNSQLTTQAQVAPAYLLAFYRDLFVGIKERFNAIYFVIEDCDISPEEQTPDLGIFLELLHNPLAILSITILDNRIKKATMTMRYLGGVYYSAIQDVYTINKMRLHMPLVDLYQIELYDQIFPASLRIQTKSWQRTLQPILVNPKLLPMGLGHIQVDLELSDQQRPHNSLFVNVVFSFSSLYVEWIVVRINAKVMLLDNITSKNQIFICSMIAEIVMLLGLHKTKDMIKVESGRANYNKAPPALLDEMLWSKLESRYDAHCKNQVTILLRMFVYYALSWKEYWRCQEKKLASELYFDFLDQIKDYDDRITTLNNYIEILRLCQHQTDGLLSLLKKWTTTPPDDTTTAVLALIHILLLGTIARRLIIQLAFDSCPVDNIVAPWLEINLLTWQLICSWPVTSTGLSIQAIIM
ncbi:hypothetical protein NEHOM01_1539 [Nematocida homosporus]|uniref:uncharacterized protein n=1 Tax=Nematocida homosporus TaxID=1912981 RepID=UPI00221F4E55|nr:uncharacterized protein NEHOM01_1539 [Nematocida homosporus]KAI5186539.1 hypothetical protein NEHOM01_1539 [Nematocida homosporus]